MEGPRIRVWGGIHRCSSKVVPDGDVVMDGGDEDDAFLGDEDTILIGILLRTNKRNLRVPRRFCKGLEGRELAGEGTAASSLK